MRVVVGEQIVEEGSIKKMKVELDSMVVIAGIEAVNLPSPQPS